MIILALEEIGIRNYTSWNTVIEAAQKETGLKLDQVPWDAAARLLLNQPGQIKEGPTYVNSETFPNRHGLPSVFVISCSEEGFELDGFWSDNAPSLLGRIAFRLIK